MLNVWGQQNTSTNGFIWQHTQKKSNQTEEAPGHGKPRMEIILLLNPAVIKGIVQWKIKIRTLFTHRNVVRKPMGVSFLRGTQKEEIGRMFMQLLQ